MLTVGLDLAGVTVTVIGGGNVAARKAEALLGAGARVRVISPAFAPAFDGLAVERVTRMYAPGDLADAFLVVVATGSPDVDVAVAAEARAAGRLVNAAAAPELGNVHFTAEVHRGPVTVAVATGGASPALARRLKAEVERAVGPEWGALAELLSEVRDRLRTMPDVTQPQRAAIYHRIVEGPALELLARGETEQARALVREALAAR